MPTRFDQFERERDQADQPHFEGHTGYVSRADSSDRGAMQGRLPSSVRYGVVAQMDDGTTRGVGIRNGEVRYGQRDAGGALTMTNSNFETREDVQARIVQQEQSLQETRKKINAHAAQSRIDEAEINARIATDQRAQMINRQLESRYERAAGGRGAAGARASERLRGEADAGWVSDAARERMQDVAASRLHRITPEEWMPDRTPQSFADMGREVEAIGVSLDQYDPFVRGISNFMEAATAFDEAGKRKAEIDASVQPSAFGIELQPEQHQEFIADILEYIKDERRSTSGIVEPTIETPSERISKKYGITTEQLKGYAGKVTSQARERHEIIQSKQGLRESVEQAAKEAGVNVKDAMRQFRAGELDEMLAGANTKKEQMEAAKTAMQQQRSSMLEDWKGGTHTPLTRKDRDQIASTPGGLRYLKEYDEKLDSVALFMKNEIVRYYSELQEGEKAGAELTDEVIMRFMSHPNFMPSMIGDLRVVTMNSIKDWRA